MAERIVRDRRLTPEEIARDRAIRAEFASRPSKTELLASGNYVGPMSIEEYQEWRKSSQDASLAKQLRVAIQSCDQSTSAIAQASGVPQPVLQRFLSGQRGITLETADKLAGYLGLALTPTVASKQ